MTNVELAKFDHFDSEFEDEIERRMLLVETMSNTELADELAWCERNYRYYDITAHYMPLLVAKAVHVLRYG